MIAALFLVRKPYDNFVFRLLHCDPSRIGVARQKILSRLTGFGVVAQQAIAGVSGGPDLSVVVRHRLVGCAPRIWRLDCFEGARLRIEHSYAVPLKLAR